MTSYWIPKKAHQLPKLAGKAYFRLAQRALTVALLAYLAYFFYANESALELFLSISPVDLAALLGLNVAYLAIQAYRMRVVLQSLAQIRIPYMQWLNVFVTGALLNRIGMQAGNIYRGLHLKHRYSLSYTSYAVGFLFFSWIDVLALSLFGALSVLLIEPGFELHGHKASHLLSVLFIALAVAPQLMRLFLARIRPELPSDFRLLRKAQQVSSAVAALSGNRLMTIWVAAVGVLNLVPFGLRVFFAFQAIGVDLTASGIILATSILKLISMISITPGNVGVQELALGLAAQYAGAGVPEGVVAAIVFRVTTNVSQILISIACNINGLRSRATHPRS